MATEHPVQEEPVRGPSGPKSASVPGSRTPRSSTAPGPRRQRAGLREFGNLATKLAVGFAIAASPIVATKIERRISGTTLLTQREQAESQLRAKMLGDLIVPVTGSPDSTGMDPNRERLLVELLALNFHEHFEFKPLLLHVDARLGRKDCPRLTREDAGAARYSLRSIARRVASRQIAALASEDPIEKPRLSLAGVGLPWGRKNGPDRSVASRVDEVSFHGGLSKEDSTSRAIRGELFAPFGGAVYIRSPDQRDLLTLVLDRPDWTEDTVHVELIVESWQHRTTQGAGFVLTWFDFPLTDNMRLRSGNRIAIVLNEVRPKLEGEPAEMVVQVVWFPRGFVTPPERPVNYKKLQELVG